MLSEILVKHSDGSTLPYSGPNLATMLSGVTDPVFGLERVDVKGNPYPFTLKLEIKEFTIANLEIVWNLLLSNPDQPVDRL